MMEKIKNFVFDYIFLEILKYTIFSKIRYIELKFNIANIIYAYLILQAKL